MSFLIIGKNIERDIITYQPFCYKDDNLKETLPNYPTLNDAVEAGLQTLFNLEEQPPSRILLIDESDSPSSEGVKTLMFANNEQIWIRNSLKRVPSIKAWTKPINIFWDKTRFFT